MQSLHKWGWSHFFSQQLDLEDVQNFKPGRIVTEQRGLYRLTLGDGEAWGNLSGRLLHQLERTAFFPAVGDWVLVKSQPDAHRAVIDRILERKSVIARRKIDSNRLDDWAGQDQVLAANVDTALIVGALNRELNFRRLERCVVLAKRGGAQPVILLSKSDLAGDGEKSAAEAARLFADVATIPFSSKNGWGLDKIESLLTPGSTAVLFGSSGVGKSTLVNRLLGREVQAVSEIREFDDKGRHTTTSRMLFAAPNGALIIDTPGIRSLGLMDDAADIAEVFPDVEAIVAKCRYRNCSHGGEPGCAVRTAIENGVLDAARWAGYAKLTLESREKSREELQALRKKEGKRIALLVKNMKRRRDYQ